MTCTRRATGQLLEQLPTRVGDRIGCLFSLDDTRVMSTCQRAFIADERPSLTHAVKTGNRYTLCGRLGSLLQGEFVLRRLHDRGIGYRSQPAESGAADDSSLQERTTSPYRRKQHARVEPHKPAEVWSGSPLGHAE